MTSTVFRMSCIAPGPKLNNCTDSFLSFVWHSNSHSRFHGEKYWRAIGILDGVLSGANARATWHLGDSEYTNTKTLLGHSYIWIQAWKLVRVLAFTWAKHGRGDFWNTLNKHFSQFSEVSDVNRSVSHPPPALPHDVKSHQGHAPSSNVCWQQAPCFMAHGLRQSCRV